MIVVEYVEDLETAALPKELGVNRVRGYHFGRSAMMKYQGPELSCPQLSCCRLTRGDYSLFTGRQRLASSSRLPDHRDLLSVIRPGCSPSSAGESGLAAVA